MNKALCGKVQFLNVVVAGTQSLPLGF